MDPSLQHSLNAIRPYLTLCESASTPAAVTDIISRAISSPSAFTFTELLAMPQVQELRRTEQQYKSYLDLLEIFCWGTYEDYKNTPNLPALTQPQIDKLRILTLLSICVRPPIDLAYTRLQAELDIPPASLIPIIHRTIYLGFLTGRLSSVTQTFHVASIAPIRGLTPNSVPSMLSTLEVWLNRCEATESAIKQKIQDIKDEAYERACKRGDIFELSDEEEYDEDSDENEDNEEMSYDAEQETAETSITQKEDKKDEPAES